MSPKPHVPFPDALAGLFVHLLSETLEDATAEREAERQYASLQKDPNL